jgi:hypothetical protein
MLLLYTPDVSFDFHTQKANHARASAQMERKLLTTAIGFPHAPSGRSGAASGAGAGTCAGAGAGTGAGTTGTGAGTGAGDDERTFGGRPTGPAELSGNGVEILPFRPPWTTEAEAL